MEVEVFCVGEGVCQMFNMMMILVLYSCGLCEVCGSRTVPSGLTCAIGMLKDAGPSWLGALLGHVGW